MDEEEKGPDEGPTEEEAKEEAGAGVSLEVSAFRTVLRRRGFTALWIGQGISGIGDWVIVGVLLDTVNRMGGETGLFWMMTFRFLPAFLFGLIAGTIVDRLERKTLMVSCEIARAALVVVLAFSNSLWMICVLVFFIECFSLLFGPARDSSIPDLVAREEVISANSLMSTSTYLTMAIGTMLATVILGLAALIYRALPFMSQITSAGQFQQKFAFIVDALTFLASAMLIFTIAFPRRFEEKQKMSTTRIWADLKEGIGFMWRDDLTRAILGVMVIGFIGGGSLYILGAPFAQQVLHSVGAKFTLILTMLLFGVVGGAAVAPFVSRKLPKERWFGRAVIGFGVTMIIFALVDFYPLALAVSFLEGVLLGYVIVTAYTMLHQNLSEDVRGRVFGAMQTIMRTCLLLSMGTFALISWLFGFLIPWTKDAPVFKNLDLGFMTKSFYPSMLAMMVGGAIVIIGGIVCIRLLHRYFSKVGGEAVEEPAPAA